MLPYGNLSMKITDFYQSLETLVSVDVNRQIKLNPWLARSGTKHHSTTVVQEQGSSWLGCMGPLSEDALKRVNKLRLKYKRQVSGHCSHSLDWTNVFPVHLQGCISLLDSFKSRYCGALCSRLLLTEKNAKMVMFTVVSWRACSDPASLSLADEMHCLALFTSWFLDNDILHTSFQSREQQSANNKRTDQTLPEEQLVVTLCRWKHNYKWGIREQRPRARTQEWKML